MKCSLQVPDDAVPDVVALLERVVEDCGKVPGEICLEEYISPNFMGFFIKEDESASALRAIAARFAKDLSTKKSS